jgi:hypothetical protein
MWVTPSEEEIFKVSRSPRANEASNASQRYSPELQKKALASREQRQKDFDGFVHQLKDLSKSDKPSKCCYRDVDTRLKSNVRSLDCTEGARCKAVSCRAAAFEGRARCICCGQQETAAGDSERLAMNMGLAVVSLAFVTVYICICMSMRLIKIYASPQES